jgi:serine/threonine protein kinase
MDCGVHIGPGDVVLDKYRVERVLGIGGMGLIVAARHLVLDELFAIKLMLPSFAADREAQERFLREARAAARLKGDHVAKVQDVGCLPDGTSYMVMEYLEGEDLKKIVRRNGAFPIADAVEYTLQTCKALREAHSLGIVHRDIKPANLMLVSLPDGAPRVKVIDFGISKHTAAVSEGLTTSSWAGGSPLYMPPEQVRSARTVDARADVWSVGAVLYELLTGVTPFHASSVAAVLQRVLNEDPVPPCVLRDSLSTALGAVVMRCLAKRPEDRFQSIDEVVEALRDAFPAAAAPPYQRDSSMPPAGASLADLPSDRLSHVPPAAAVTAMEGPRASSSSAVDFSQVASVPPAEPGGAPARTRRVLPAVAVAAAVMGCVSGVGVLWQRFAPATTFTLGRPAGAGEVAPQVAPAAPPPPPPPAAVVEPAASTLPTAVTGRTIAIPGVASPGSIPKTAPGEKAQKSAGRPGPRPAPGGPLKRKAKPLY